MKKRFTFALTLVLTAGLSWAQTGAGSGKTTQADTKKSAKTSSAGSKVTLNPQPLPPGAKSKTASPADKVSLNPQPLPPKEGKTGTTSAESKVALNPQPLPPGAQSSTKKKNAAAGKKVSAPANASSPKQ